MKKHKQKKTTIIVSCFIVLIVYLVFWLFKGTPLINLILKILTPVYVLLGLVSIIITILPFNILGLKAWWNKYKNNDTK